MNAPAPTMNPARTRTLALAAALAAGTANSALGQNQVLNGGFETGPTAPGYLALPTSPAVSDWQVVLPGPHHARDYFLPSIQGKSAIDLQAGAVQQAFPRGIQPGASGWNLMVFDAAGVRSGGTRSAAMDVTLLGLNYSTYHVIRSFSLPTTLGPATSVQWHTRAFPFDWHNSGNGSVRTIFRSLDTAGVVVDNVYLMNLQPGVNPLIAGCAVKNNCGSTFNGASLLASLQTPGNGAATVRSDAQFTAGLLFAAQVPSPAPAALTVSAKLKRNANFGPAAFQFQVYNWSTGQWVSPPPSGLPQTGVQLGTTWATYSFSVPGSWGLSNYVHPAGNLVLARLDMYNYAAWSPFPPPQPSPFRVIVDRVWVR